jgi:hypothetical protein
MVVYVYNGGYLFDKYQQDLSILLSAEKQRLEFRGKSPLSDLNR